MIEINMVLTRGYQIASGKSENSPFPKGTIELQKNIFNSMGLNLEKYYSGTLNLTSHFFSFNIIKFDYIFENVKWIENFPAETFLFVKCFVLFKNKKYKAFIYQPKKETKICCKHQDNVLEIISEFIPDISYGNSCILEVENGYLEIFDIENK